MSFSISYKIHARRDWYTDGVHIHLAQITHRDGVDHWAAALPVTLEKFDFAEQGGTMRDPMLTLPEEAAQQLVNALWEAGFRPSQAKGSAGQLAATERHLEDMRALVFAHPMPEKK